MHTLLNDFSFLGILNKSKKYPTASDWLEIAIKIFKLFLIQNNLFPMGYF